MAAHTGSALKAWRVSDGALKAIGFTAAGDMDMVTALTQSFSSAVSPTSPLQVWGWYDQSGNGLNIYQSSTTADNSGHGYTGALSTSGMWI